MRGLRLVEHLNEMGCVQRTLQGAKKAIPPFLPATEGRVIYGIKGVLVARGCDDQEVEIISEIVNHMLDLLREAPDLCEFYDEESFRRLVELAAE